MLDTERPVLRRQQPGRHPRRRARGVRAGRHALRARRAGHQLQHAAQPQRRLRDRSTTCSPAPTRRRPTATCCSRSRSSSGTAPIRAATSTMCSRIRMRARRPRSCSTRWLSAITRSRRSPWKSRRAATARTSTRRCSIGKVVRRSDALLRDPRDPVCARDSTARRWSSGTPATRRRRTATFRRIRSRWTRTGRPRALRAGRARAATRTRARARRRANRQMKSDFLQTGGKLVDLCGGAACVITP